MSENQGKFIFEAIKEEDRIIKFNPPLVVEYTIIDDLGHATFDFGMEMDTQLNASQNYLVNGYGGLTKESSKEDIFMNTIIFDIFHAMFHPSQDPNYSHYYWALAGWLKDRIMNA